MKESGGKLWSSFGACQVFGEHLERGGGPAWGPWDLGMPWGGGRVRELGVSFLVAEALDQVCIRPTLPLQLEAKEWGGYHSSWGALRNPLED